MGEDVNLVIKFLQKGILEKSNVANKTRLYKNVVLKGLDQDKNKETKELACECVKNLDDKTSTNEIDKLLITTLGKIRKVEILKNKLKIKSEYFDKNLCCELKPF